MFIKKIQKLKYGIFQNFLWNSKLEEFNENNIIFGWNGTGKTTISRLLRSLETGVLKTEDGSQISFSVQLLEGGKIENLNKKHKNIFVFNKDFIDEVIFSPESKEYPPTIFFIGDVTPEIEKRIIAIETELSKVSQAERDASISLTSSNREKTEKEKTVAKLIKETVSTGGDGPYNVFSATHFINFLSEIENKIEENIDIDFFKLSEQRMVELKKSIKNSDILFTKKSEISSIETSLNENYFIELSSLLQKNIERKIIERLEKDEVLSDWVYSGINLHRDKEICRFCEQKMPEKHVQKLLDYFNEEYEKLKNDLIKKQAFLKNVDFSKINDTPIRAQVEKLNLILTEILSAIEEKIKLPSKFIKISDSIEVRLASTLTSITELLGDPESLIEKNKKDLANHYIASEYVDYKSIVSNKDKHQKQVNLNLERKKLLEVELSEKKAEIQNTKIPVDTINSYLRKILGHNEIKLRYVEDVSGYKIIRNDTLEATSLSEGEKTAIAVSYFLVKLDSKDIDITQACVVFDDPISSLDLNALYTIHALIIEKVKNAKQRFFLTHNFDFFNLLKRSYKKKSSNKNKRSAFSLQISLKDKIRSSRIDSLDPVLDKFDSEYQYLFKLMNDFRFMSEVERKSLKTIFPYPNIARRFLETYLKFKCPNMTDFRGMLESRPDMDTDDLLKIYQFTNDQSHGKSDDSTGFSYGITSPSAKDIIELIMKLIEKDDKDHYEGLLASIK